MKRNDLISIVLLIVLVGIMVGIIFARRTIEYAEPERTPIPDAIHPPVEETPTPWKRIEVKDTASYVGPLRGGPVTMPEDPVILSAAIAPEDETKTVLRYVGRFDVCGYDTCPQCCGNRNGIAKSGTVATVGRTIAANAADFPIGTVLYIEGIGERVVEDRGYMTPGVLDVLCNNHAECYAITGVYDVYVVEGVE